MQVQGGRLCSGCRPMRRLPCRRLQPLRTACRCGRRLQQASPSCCRCVLAICIILRIVVCANSNASAAAANLAKRTEACDILGLWHGCQFPSLGPRCHTEASPDICRTSMHTPRRMHPRQQILSRSRGGRCYCRGRCCRPPSLLHCAAAAPPAEARRHGSCCRAGGKRGQHCLSQWSSEYS